MPTMTAPRPRATLGVRTWERWTTDCRLVVSDVTLTDAAFALTEQLMDAIGDAIDCYRTGSELNRLRPGSNRVSPLLGWFLQTAVDAARRTDGLLDPGYRSWPASGWSSIVLREDEVVIPAGIQLDLGSTGKAAAADLIAARIRRVLGCDALVSLGGDIATAGGPSRGWQVDVHDASTDAAAPLSLAAGAAIATSSTLHRTGPGGHHIVDPRTGRPAAGPWRTATVVAPTCVEANTASTAALILGAEAADWLTELGLPARLVSHDGRALTLNDFPEDQR